jgi:hypothetical protein
MEQEKEDESATNYAEWLKSLTPEEEAAILAKHKAEFGPIAVEADYRELLEQRERGELKPMEQVLRELGIDVEEDEKEPA